MRDWTIWVLYRDTKSALNLMFKLGQANAWYYPLSVGRAMGIITKCEDYLNIPHTVA